MKAHLRKTHYHEILARQHLSSERDALAFPLVCYCRFLSSFEVSFTDSLHSSMWICQPDHNHIYLKERDGERVSERATDSKACRDSIKQIRKSHNTKDDLQIYLMISFKSAFYSPSHPTPPSPLPLRLFFFFFPPRFLH